MDEANENAQREKYQKRMQHLEEGGHDVSHLKANLQGKKVLNTSIKIRLFLLNFVKF